MSDKNQARRTSVQVSFNGVNITKDIQPYLLSLTYTDNEADQSDDLQLELHDREDTWLTNWIEKAVNASLYLDNASSKDKTYPTVRYGNRSDTVKIMQQYLLKLGYSLPKAGADGIFGSETKSAVKSFQRKNGLSVDGVCGPITWAAILKQIGSATYAKGMKIQAVILRENWNGDGKDQMLDCGSFELDSVKMSGPPSKAAIKGTSLAFTSTIRQMKKSRGWESYYLSGIAKEMARKNGMGCMYSADIDPYYTRVEQYKTSDINFLSKLCKNAGISLKATNNILVLFDQEKYEAKSSVITIKKGSGTYLKWTLDSDEADSQYSSCRVRYTTAKGKLISGTAYAEDYDADSKTNQQLEIHAKVSSVAEAKALAKKHLRLHNKFERTASFTMPGNPALVAGVTVNLKGWGMWDNKYIITQAKHQVSNGGYITQIKLRLTISPAPKSNSE